MLPFTSLCQSFRTHLLDGTYNATYIRSTDVMHTYVSNDFVQCHVCKAILSLCYQLPQLLTK